MIETSKQRRGLGYHAKTNDGPRRRPYTSIRRPSPCCSRSRAKPRFFRSPDSTGRSSSRETSSQVGSDINWIWTINVVHKTSTVRPIGAPRLLHKTIKFSLDQISINVKVNLVAAARAAFACTGSRTKMKPLTRYFPASLWNFRRCCAQCTPSSIRHSVDVSKANSANGVEVVFYRLASLLFSCLRPVFTTRYHRCVYVMSGCVLHVCYSLQFVKCYKRAKGKRKG